MKFAHRISGGVTGMAFRVMSWFPLPLLYLLSGSVGWLACHVVRYRRRVVMDNLRSSFPEKGEDELRKIASRFYGFLADYFVETVRMGAMSRKEIMDRMRFENLDEVSGYLRAGKSVTLCLGHYCNWEWVSSLPLHFPESAACGQIYHPLEDEGVDRVFRRLRGHFGAESIPMAETLLWLRGKRKEGEASVVGYIADQVPLYNAVHCFVDFLGHDTPVFTGPERLARMFGTPVYYIDMRRERRGRYVGKMVKICDDTTAMSQFEITRRYFSMLEATIRREPAYWLWSHNRWKRTRAGFIREFGAEEAERRLSRL